MSAGAHVSALRGPAPALRSATPDARRPVRSLRPAGPLLPLAFARGVTFLALAVFGVMHWMVMIAPTATERGWYAVGIGTLAMGGLLGVPRLPSAARPLALGVIVLGALALALLAAGIADEGLRPDHWGELSSGIDRGLAALPGATVPYHGIDPWTRIVLQLGGTLLVAVAALVAFWPRRAGRTGFPLAALILLVTLYAVPAVALDFKGEFLRGAALSLLVVAFLRLERLRLAEAPGAAALAAAAAVGALIVAPALDGNSPWWDYESWALSTASARSTAFSWNHSYGPLAWPRDGREMLRVKAKQAAYWKAESLDLFDGTRWRQSPAGTHEAAEYELPSNPATRRRWSQRIKVSIRNLRTNTFVTAGIPLDAPDLPNRAAIPSGPPGIWFASRTLRRGDTYSVPVYTPRPTEHELAVAGTTYDRDLSQYLTIGVFDSSLTRVDAPAARGPVPVQVEFGDWNHPATAIQAVRLDRSSNQGGQFLDGVTTLQRSNLKRTWALSQRLKRGAANPLQYTKAVEAYLGRNFSYSEAPPASAQTLEGFLFKAREGYCQQYSGAMALLMRMAGIPTRVASGFTSGSFDRRSGEYVVRDLDAHSWVEGWFPNIGWVTFDPTPSTAPPRSQANGERGARVAGDAPDLGGAGRRLDPRRSAAASQRTRWERVVLAAVVALALLALVGLALYRRRHAGAPLPELERALRRARRAPGPGATLQALEASFVRSPAAAAYVRALREQRYGGRGGEPTRSQRRGLRAELGRGGGPLGRLRAWWALPPRPRLPWGRRRTIGGHG